MLRETKDDEALARTADVAAAIAEEGLRYVSDASPGHRRKRTGTWFSYYDKDGKLCRLCDCLAILRML